MTPTPTTWRKSSYSINAGNCVELAAADDDVLLRDSKHPEAGHLTFTRAELAAFIAAASAGELDYLL
jgi:hypothetical protein